MRDRTASTLLTVAAIACLNALGCASAARAATVTATEFYHAGFDHYFITASAAEAAILDAGTTIKGWARTGTEFKVDDAPGPGLVPVCRFFSASFAPKSSHFYTPFADECAKVKANPDWTFEAEAFYVRLPDNAGACTPGTTPVYRYYNNGQGGAPNHKYTPYASEREAFVAMGWIPEGVGPEAVLYCVPYFGSLAQQRTQQMAGAWEFRYAIDSQSFVARATFGPAEATGDPEFPYAAPADDALGLGFAGWDPYAAKIGALLVDAVRFHVLFFDFSGGNDVQGCAFDVRNLQNPLPGRCFPMTGRRL
jgi:hypothetical protein